MRIHMLPCGALCAALLASSTAHAQQYAGAELPNGLKIVVITTNTGELDVATGFFFGYRDEPADRRGIAHLLEHLAMRETRDGRSIAAGLQKAGVSAGASTNASTTMFSETVPFATDSMLRKILDVAAARMTQLSLAEHSIDVEKRRIRIEVGNRRPSDSSAVTTFPGLRIGRVSSHTGLNEASRADLERLYDRYYAPSNCVIVVSSPMHADHVLAIAREALGAVPRRTSPVRPIYRDSSVVLSSLRITHENSTQPSASATLVVPGIQDERRRALESEVAAWRAELSAAPADGRRVTLNLENDFPVALLRLTAQGTSADAAKLTLDSLIGAKLISSNPVMRVVVDHGSAPDAVALVTCEAAGDWRYCLDASTASGSPVLARMLSETAARTRSVSTRTVLWPARMRKVDTTTLQLVAHQEATTTSAWEQPAPETNGWVTTRSGLQWSSARGGMSDSVVFALRILPDTKAYVSRDVAALEVLSRTLMSSKLGQVATGDSLLALHARVSVTSLPYPPLATADKFRMLNAAPSAIGTLGLQITGTAPRSTGSDVIALIRHAIAAARVDTVVVKAEIARQRATLRESMGSNNVESEIVFRQSLPVASPMPPETSRPLRVPEQLQTMEQLVPGDVDAAMRILSGEGSTTRIALLGVDSATAKAWLGPAIARPAQAVESRAQDHACTDVATSGATQISGERGNLFIAVCLPTGNGNSVPAAAAVANALIGGREDALLAATLRSEKGLVYDFESRMVPVSGTHATLWYLRVGTRALDGNAVVAEVRNILKGVGDDAGTVTRIEEYRTWLAQQRRTQARDSERWVNTMVAGGIPLDVLADEIQSVSPADVIAVLRMMSEAVLLVVPSVTHH